MESCNVAAVCTDPPHSPYSYTRELSMASDLIIIILDLFNEKTSLPMRSHRKKALKPHLSLERSRLSYSLPLHRILLRSPLLPPSVCWYHHRRAYLHLWRSLTPSYRRWSSLPIKRVKRYEPMRAKGEDSRYNAWMGLLFWIEKIYKRFWGANDAITAIVTQVGCLLTFKISPIDLMERN